MLTLVFQVGRAEEILPLPNGSPSRTVEQEQIPQACLPIPVDPAGQELTVDIQPRSKDSQIVPQEKLPADCAPSVFPSIPMFHGDFASGQHTLGYDWAAARFCHRPLYFQEYAVERCGVHRGCFQPLISGIHFFGNAVLLPWKMWQNPPRGCQGTPFRDCTTSSL